MSKYIPIFIVLLAVGIILGGIFLIWPKYQQLQENQLKLKAKQSELTGKEAYYSKLKDTAAEIPQYQEELDKIDLALPSEISTPVLYNFIQNITSANGLVLKSISRKDSPGTGDAGESNIYCSLGVSGSYSAFKNFLDVLHKNIKIIDVESIKFSSPASGQPAGGALFNFDLSIRMPVYQASASGKETPGGAPSLSE